MPQELLSFLPSYLFIGVYRLITDRQLYRPIWDQSKSTLKTSLIYSSIFGTISYPITKIWVRFFMRKSSIQRYYYSPSTTTDSYQSSSLSSSSSLFYYFFSIFSITNFVTISLVLSQIGWLIEFSLRKRLKSLRNQAYEMTIRSRAKGDDFWMGYVEEWEVPPVEKARRRISKRRWYRTLASPLIRIVLLKIILTPLYFVPFLNLIISSFLNSITLSENLLDPYFRSKKMTEIERSIFIVERQNELRLVGFFASILERVPLVGIIFSISNRIGYGMMSHDFEKRQRLVLDGKVKKNSVGHRSKTREIELDLPRNSIGNFPKKYDDDDDDCKIRKDK